MVKITTSIIRGVKWTAIDRWGNHLLRIGVIAVLARLLTREDFGLVAAATVFIDYLATYIGQGLGLAVIQRERLEIGHLNAVFWINMAFGIFLTGAIWFLAPTFVSWFRLPNAIEVFRWLSFSLLLQAMSAVQTAYLVRQMRFQTVALLNLVGSLSGGIIAIVMAIQGYGVWSLVAQQLVGGAVQRIALWAVSGWKPGVKFSKRHLKELYRFSIVIFADQQVLFLSRRFDEALVAGFLGISELGLYSIAKRLVLLLQEVIEMPFGQVLISAFSRMQNVPEEMARLADRTFSVASLLALPAFGGLIALSPEAIELIFGSSWLDAVWPVRIMSFGMLLFAVPLTIYPTLLALGRPAVLLGLNSFSALLGALLIFAGARFGVVGVAAAISIRQLVVALAGIIVMKRNMGSFYNIKIIRPVFIFTICSFLCAFSARMIANAMNTLPLAVVAMVSVLLGASVYLWVMWFIDKTSLRQVLVVASSLLSFRDKVDAKA